MTEIFDNIIYMNLQYKKYIYIPFFSMNELSNTMYIKIN